jgi:ABC-type amino acid transport substrate-binding protein
VTGRAGPRRAAALLALLFGYAGTAPAQGTGPAAPLAVCLEENLPPLSVRKGREAAGFDVAVARRVAELLGRPLAVQWFETRADPDSHPDREVNALLSDGRCQLVGGFPLSARSLTRTAERSKLPDFAGARPEDRRRWVGLGTLAPTRAYRSTALGVVLSPRLAGLPLRHLAELKDMRLGVEERTLADAILTSYRNGMLIEQVSHVTAGPALFERLERGEVDAVLVEVHRWDAWRALHPASGLTLAAYRHPVGFNLGFVGLEAEAPLLAEVNGALERMRQGGELAELARQAGVTPVELRSPDISPPITRAALLED